MAYPTISGSSGFSWGKSGFECAGRRVDRRPGDAAGAQAQEHPIDARALQALGAREHELSDPDARIALPAAVAQRLVSARSGGLIRTVVARRTT
jgi:hypothetical protein